jgi:hypothetical protein
MKGSSGGQRPLAGIVNHTRGTIEARVVAIANGGALR